MASNAGAIRAGRAFVEAYLDSSKLEKSLGTVRDKLKAFSRQLGAIGGTLTAAGAAILAPMAASVKMFADAGDELHKMSKRTGVAVESLSALDFAASQSGTSLQSLEKALIGMARFSVNAGRGLSSATDTLGDLNLKADDLLSMSPERRFVAIAEALSKVEDPTTRAGLAMQVFGRAGTELLPMLENGGQGIDQLMARARELGIVMTDEDANAAAEMTDALDELMRSVKFLTVTVARELLPEALNFSRFLTETIPSIRDWLGENKGLIITLAKLGAGLAVVGTGLIVTASLISAVGTVAGVASTAAKLLSGNLMTVATAATAAFAIAAIILFAREVYKANSAVQELNKELKRSADLNDKIAQRQRSKQVSVIDKANSLSGEERDAFIADELAMAEKEMAGTQASLKRQKELVDDLAPTWKSLWQAGKASHQVEQQELEAINQRLEQQKSHIQELRKLKAEQQQELDVNAGRTDEELKGIEGILGKLNEELETMGLDSGEKAIRQLERLNANEKELAQARAALADIEQKKEQAEKEKKEKEAADKVAETLEGLWQDLADMDLSPIERAVENQMRELEALGATPEQLALAEQLVREKEQQMTKANQAEPGFQDNNALEVGSGGALSAFLRATQGPGSDEAKTAENTARIAELQAELIRLQKREAKKPEIVFGRGG